MQREINESKESPRSSSSYKEKVSDGEESSIIQPRSFHALDFSVNSVIKTTTTDSLHGEIFFYKNIPESLQHFFPKLIDYQLGPSCSITIDRIYGIPLSKKIVKYELGREVVLKTLECLNEMHSTSFNGECDLPSQSRVQTNDKMYSNYASKIRARHRKFSISIFDKLGLFNSTHFEPLLELLDNYEVEDRGCHADIIHGDPVFSNVLSTDDTNDLKFIDMRGSQGSLLTLQGDVVYDLAKVYQSLMGYDFILLDVQISENSVLYMSSLIYEFWKYIDLLYPNIRPEDLIIACTALYTSLIPLHDDEIHRIRYSTIAKTMLKHCVRINRLPSTHAASNSAKSVHQEILREYILCERQLK